jgi:hypothetical protein
MRLFVTILTLILVSCNPFAPNRDDELGGNTFLSDQTTVDGLFENWALSYNFRDTLIYARVLSDDFVFSYRNFDLATDNNWDRETDIRKTHGLFSSSKYIDLVWNDYLFSNGDDTSHNATRQFSLQISFSDNDIVNINGRANVKLHRANLESEWKLLQWNDESNF